MTATWKDLCLDALDPLPMGRFWAQATGLQVADRGDDVFLTGATPAHRVWINAVDRPRQGKNRVHLDVDCHSIDDLVLAGARILSRPEDTGFGWYVMADPEDNEFCAFVRRAGEVPAYRLHGLGIDSQDPEAQARWWGGILGVPPTPEAGEDWWTITGAAADDRMTLDFAPVPEPRVEPNRVHWDLYGDVAELTAAGARVLWELPEWTTMADPEGNEFCVFPFEPDPNA